MTRARWALIGLAAGAVLAVGAAGFVGPAGFDVPAGFLRWSRVLLGALAGGALAVCGAVLQSLFKNPLADPYVVGVSGGAALGGALVIALLPTAFGLLEAGALGGALLATLVLAAALVRAPAHRTGELVLLIGILINAFASALITLVKTLVDASTAQSMLFWLVGMLRYPAPTVLGALAAVLGAGLFVLLRDADRLNIVRAGDDEARRLGVDPVPVRRRALVVTAVIVGALVPVCGMIGFVGLVVPHLARALVGADHHRLVPAAALLGAALLVLSDAACRGLFASLGTELPVGAITALVGAPSLAWILLRQLRNGQSHA